ncbi:unnamed protein product, partial [Effrenium voratum]
ATADLQEDVRRSTGVGQAEWSGRGYRSLRGGDRYDRRIPAGSVVECAGRASAALAQVLQRLYAPKQTARGIRQLLLGHCRQA